MQIDLRQWYKCDIDRATRKALSQRSDWKGIGHVIIYFSVLLITGYFAYITWGTWWSLFWFLVYGNIFAFSNAIQHETNHGTFFKSKWLNHVFWHISSFMCAFEPIRWKWTHFAHHAHTLHTKNPYDFENQITRPTDVIEFFLKFIPFGSVFTIHKSFHYVHRETILHALGKVTPVLKESVPEKQRPEAMLWARIHVSLWGAVCVVSLFAWNPLPIIYILLPNFYGNTCLNLCSITQHAGLSLNERDHRLNTRTVLLNPVLSFLYCHMEYHIEHHIFPMVPCHNLKKLHHVVKEQLPEPSKGLIGAYKEIIPAVVKQASDTSYYIKVTLPT